MKAARLRSIVGLVTAAVVLGVFTLSPVAAHFTTNTAHLGQHAWKQVIKKKVNKTFQKKCKDGSVLAWVWIDASTAKAGPAGYSGAGVGRRFNCAGGAPVLRSSELVTGITYLKFPGITNKLGTSGELIATATIGQCGGGCETLGMVAADTITDGADGRVLRIVTQDDTGTTVDVDFVVVVYGRAGTTTSPTVAETGDTSLDQA